MPIYFPAEKVAGNILRAALRYFYRLTSRHNPSKKDFGLSLSWGHSSKEIGMSRDGEGKMEAEKRGCHVKNDPLASAQATGLGCWDAEFAAKQKLFATLETYADKYDVESVLTVACSCKSGVPATATCCSGVHALWTPKRAWNDNNCPK